MFGISTRGSLFRHWRKKRLYVPELGERHTLCNWVLDEDEHPGPMVEQQRYGELLSLLPDKIVSNLERARLARDGRVPMLKAGLGYEELLASVIVDGTPITSSSTENILFPDLMLPANYMQPGGIPGRTLHWKARGRQTTLSTAGTLTFAIGHAATAVTTISGAATCWAKSGALTMDTTAQTATMWFCEGKVVARTVGTAGTVFGMGDATCAAQALTIANQQAQYMGSAGSATPAAVTMDMTINEFVAFTAKWSLTTAYSITGHVYALEALN
jgi:hypothetical protein